MNAPIPVTPRCDGCGEPEQDSALYDHEGSRICGLCLDDVLDANAGHDELEPDTSSSLALEDRRGSV